MRLTHFFPLVNPISFRTPKTAGLISLLIATHRLELAVFLPFLIYCGKREIAAILCLLLGQDWWHFEKK